jgi:glycosyltransferase involved in cell wall biosynthesis
VNTKNGNMLVWILNVGENMPTDGEDPRLFRTGILVDYLVSRGHKVIWWTSTFDHYKRCHRFNYDKDVIMSSNYVIKFLHGFGYKNNVSFTRLLDHFILGNKFSKLSKSEKLPDLIISSFPIISFSSAAVKFGRLNSVPVVIDARDMWPDIFLDTVSPKLRIVLKPFLIVLFGKTKFIFRNAKAITGMTKNFVDWGLLKAGRNATIIDRPFPFGYKKCDLILNEIEKASIFEQFKLNRERQIVILVSYIGNVLDINLLISFAIKLKELDLAMDVVVCGTGDKYELLKQKCDNILNIKLLGWCDSVQILKLLKISFVGLLPYKNRLDFRNSIPNKVAEYMSAGLPIISSVAGVVENILRENNCGFFVENSDDFVEVIEKLAEDKELYLKMSQNATNYFNNNFESNKVYTEMCEYLENIANYK